jgi:hypothetical protein
MKYRYAVVNDRRVIVEPRTRKIIKIINRASDLSINPRGNSCPAGIFYQDSAGSGPARSLKSPIKAGSDHEAGTGRQRIDDEIFKLRMPSRCPELQDFDYSDHDDGNHRGEQPIPRIGQTECQPEQDERQRMLAVLAEVGMRPELWRSQRREGDGSGQQPGE